jgi:hypothetical protein
MEDTKASLLMTRPGAKQIFPGLKAKFREAIPQTLSLYKELGVARLPLQQLLDALEDLGLQFENDEMDYMQRRYADFKDEVSFANMVETLDILPPKEHVDPDQFSDNLPQPYRMVSKLIEQYILDAAWLEVIRRHPDVEVGSDGNPINLPKNRNLQEACEPTVMKQGPPPSNVQSMYDGAGPCHLMATSSGMMHVTDSVKGKHFKSLPVFPHATEKKARVTIQKAITEGSSMRVVLIETATTWEAPSVDPAAKPKKGEEEPEPVLVTKNSVAVVDVRLPGSGERGGMREEEIESRLIASMEMPGADTTDLIVVDLTSDGQVMTIQQSCAGAALFVYELPRLSMAGLWPKDLGKVEETKEHTFGEEGTVLELKEPMCQFSPCKLLGLGEAEAAPVISCTLFQRGPGLAAKSQRKPPPPPTLTPSADGEAPAEETLPVAPAPAPSFDPSEVGLAITLEGVTKWIVVSFRQLNQPVPADGTPPSTAMLVEPFVVKEMLLSAAPTVATTDPGRSLLVVGQADGMVCCYNLFSLLLTSAAGRHEVAVSAVALIRRDRTDQTVQNNMLPGRGGLELEFFLVSGALDGSMCFFTVNVPRLFAAEKTLRDCNTLPETDARIGYRCLRTELFHFRHDYTCPIVSIRGFDSKALALVQADDGIMAIYDVEGAALLGKLVTATGMALRANPSRLASASDLWSPAAAAKPAKAEGEEVEPAAALEEAKEEDKETKRVDGDETPEASSTAKRAPKYSLSSIEDSRAARASVCIAATSAAGVGAIFMRANDAGEYEPTYTSFSIDHLVKTLCPGVEKFTHSAKWQTASPGAIFSMLTPVERQSSTVDVSAFASAAGGDLPVSVTSGSRTGTSGTGGPPSRKASGTRSGAKNGGSTAKLTTTNLQNFEASLRPLRAVPGSMLHSHCEQVIMGPVRSVEASMKASKEARAKRKEKINSRFKSIARVLQ